MAEYKGPFEAVVSFTSRVGDQTFRVVQGQKLDALPDGADWFAAGLVVPAKQERETATKKAAETRAKKAAAKPKKQPAKKGPVDKTMTTKDLGK